MSMLLFFCGPGLADSYVSPYIYLEKVKAALTVYREDCGHYPNQQFGLNLLVSSSEVCWRGQYIRERFLNGYRGRPIKYTLIMEQGQPEVELSTYGEDLWWGTADDIRFSDDVKTRSLKFGRMIDKQRMLKNVAMILSVFGFYGVAFLLFCWFCKFCHYLFQRIQYFLNN